MISRILGITLVVLFLQTGVCFAGNITGRKIVNTGKEAGRVISVVGKKGIKEATKIFEDAKNANPLSTNVSMENVSGIKITKITSVPKITKITSVPKITKITSVPKITKITSVPTSVPKITEFPKLSKKNFPFQLLGTQVIHGDEEDEEGGDDKGGGTGYSMSWKEVKEWFLVVTKQKKSEEQIEKEKREKSKRKQERINSLSKSEPKKAKPKHKTKPKNSIRSRTKSNETKTSPVPEVTKVTPEPETETEKNEYFLNQLSEVCSKYPIDVDVFGLNLKTYSGPTISSSDVSLPHQINRNEFGLDFSIGGKNLSISSDLTVTANNAFLSPQGPGLVTHISIGSIYSDWSFDSECFTVCVGLETPLSTYLKVISATSSVTSRLNISVGLCHQYYFKNQYK